MIGDASTVRKQDISLRIVGKRGKKVPRKRMRSPGTVTIEAGHWARDCYKKQKDKANGAVKKDEKTGKNSQNSQKTYKKRGGIKATGSDEEEEEEQLALEYEEEADDISRLRGRSRRSRETKSGFRNRSARQ